MDLSRSNVSGIIPTEIGNAVALTYLNLGETSLSGHIPSQMGKLILLQTLDMSYNGNLVGGIPSSFAKLKALKFLSFHYCVKLIDVGTKMPTWLGGLLALTHLDLGGMRHFTNLPSDLSKLTALDYLDVSDNAIDGTVPGWLGSSLKKLTHLDIHYNEFTGAISTSIASLKSLQYLDAGYNSFSKAMPEWIGGMIKLEYLDLSYNGFTGTISTTYGELKVLQHLDLNSNSRLSLGTLPSQLWSLSSLSYLDVSSCRINGSLPNTLSLTSLQYLDTSYNFISGTLPSQLEGLTSLSFLKLSSCQINGSLPNSLSRLISLQYFDAGSNSISGTLPNSLVDLTGLTYLDLSFNLIDGTLPLQLGNLRSLTYLRLNYNHLRGAIPASLGNLTSDTISISLAYNINLNGSISNSFCNYQNRSKFVLDILGDPFLCQPECFTHIKSIQLVSSGDIDICGKSYIEKHGYVVQKLFFDGKCDKLAAAIILKTTDCYEFKDIGVNWNFMRLSLKQYPGNIQLSYRVYSDNICLEMAVDDTSYQFTDIKAPLMLGRCSAVTSSKDESVADMFCDSKLHGACQNPMHIDYDSFYKDSLANIQQYQLSFINSSVTGNYSDSNLEQAVAFFGLKSLVAESGGGFAIKSFYPKLLVNSRSGNNYPNRAIVIPLGQCLEYKAIDDTFNENYGIFDSLSYKSQAHFCHRVGVTSLQFSNDSTCLGSLDSACVASMEISPFDNITATHIIYTAFDVDKVENKKTLGVWECTSPPPALEQAGIATMSLFRGSKCVASSPSVCGSDELRDWSMPRTARTYGRFLRALQTTRKLGSAVF